MQPSGGFIKSAITKFLGPSEYIVLVAEGDLLWRFVKLLPHEDVLLSNGGRGGGQPELDLVLWGGAGIPLLPSLLASPAFIALPFNFDWTQILKKCPDISGWNNYTIIRYISPLVLE